MKCYKAGTETEANPEAMLKFNSNSVDIEAKSGTKTYTS